MRFIVLTENPEIDISPNVWSAYDSIEEALKAFEKASAYKYREDNDRVYLAVIIKEVLIGKQTIPLKDI